ncbi:hypothetical protein A5821_000344 [Enterococcus sp. 7F3_DIV0205]|uniref:Uncharacterized protein n=1 Tax=Candidatus Enterococcus palustris TaxID=1834189 RepID=A0AAQ3W693_9ENTE|nr:hypothetical protein [Enterococcus sp. 7F3_DIV0205]OTN84757.1 hypothetical protein A5821_000686 [Enterococcus sp. 7F3_DIV0205]
MARRDTVKMLKDDISLYAKYVKLFNRSENWHIVAGTQKIERRVMYFEEGKFGKQYKVLDSIELQDVYSEIQFVFDHKQTMIGRRTGRGGALLFTGKGDAYKEISQRLAYNQKLKIHGKIYRLNQ